jgi:ribosomal 30S subunit maturation factor RimM
MKLFTTLLCIFFIYSAPLFSQINNGLIAYWNFCNCTAHDKTGAGHDGNLIKNPQCVDGISGDALSFSKAKANYILVPKDIKLNTPSYTIAAWFNPTYLPGGGMSWAPIISRMYNSKELYGDAYCLTLDQSGNIWYFHNGIGENFQNKVKINQWYFVVITVSNGVGKAYLNNELIGNFSTSIINSADSIPICIGCNDYNQSIPNHFFNGALDEIRLYDRAISLNEIGELYSFRAPNPQLTVTPASTTICLGDSITLKTSGNATKHSWSPSLGLSCIDCSSPVAKPVVTTKYTVTATDPEGCLIENTVVVSVEDINLSVKNKHLAIIKGDTASLEITTNANSVKWTPSVGLSCDTCKTTNVFPQKSTIYYITAKSSLGCTKTDSITVSVNEPPSSCTKISGIINNYAAVTQISNSKLFVTVADATGFKKDDQVLFIQMQGAEIDTTNTTSYGKVKDLRGAGDYEYAVIEGISGNTITFTKPLAGENYNINGKIQVVTVPEYAKAIVRDSLTCAPWNGTTGGILALSASCISLEGKIDVSGKGFRGGSYMVDPCNPESSSSLYATSSTCFARKGEGIAGFGAGDNLFGRGAPANGGGGGNSHNGGGGGGSNYGQGGTGGFGYALKPNSQAAGGIGGSFTHKSTTEVKKLFLGGGGGAGQVNNGNGSGGANGGGIILIRAGSIENSESGENFTISANGLSAANDNNPENPDGCGGGGAGGTIYIDADFDGGITAISANGGKGGSRLASTIGHGTGGGGGGGWTILTDRDLLPSNKTHNIGGKAGTSLEGGTYGATDGVNGLAIIPNIKPILTGVLKTIDSSACKSCYPTIQTAQQLCSPATFTAKDDIYLLKSLELDNTQSENLTMQLVGSFPSHQVTGILTLTDPTKPGKFLLRAVNEDDNSVTYGSQVYPVPAPLITATGANLSSSNTQPNDVLQWYINGDAINGATGKSFKAVQAGEYTLEAINIYGCKGVSAKVIVTLSGVEDIAGDEYFSLYPNPASEQILIESKQLLKTATPLEITNILGESVLKTTLPAGSFKTALSLEAIPPGTYYVHISSGTFKKVYKIVRN